MQERELDIPSERQRHAFQTLKSIGRHRRRRLHMQQASATAEQQAEELRDSRSRLEEAQSLARLGYLDWDFTANQTWWSEEVFRIFGFEPGEVEPTVDLMRQMVPSEDRLSLGRAIAEAIRSKEPQPLSYRIVRESGEVRHLSGRMRLSPGRRGEPARLVSALQDVTEQKRAEEALRRHRATLTAGQRIARLGTWDWDMKSGEVWWSDEFTRLLEPDPDVADPGFDTFLKRIHPDDRKLAEDTIERAVKEQEPFNLELRLLRADDSVAFIHASGEVIHDDDGSPWRLLGVVQDITERKHIEDELRRIRVSLETGQQVAGLGTWDWDLRTNEIWWSDQINRLFGQDLEGVAPSFDVLMQAVHPDDLPSLVEAIQAPPLDTGPSDLEVRIVAPDGSIRHALSRGQTFLDEDGTPVRMVGAFQDISERKRNEDELRRNRTLLETGQQIAGLGTWEWTFDDGGLWWSDEVYRIYGYEPGKFDATFERFVQAIHPDDRDEIVSILNSAIASGEPYNAEMRVLSADGSVRVIHARGRSILDDKQQPVRMVGAVQDITDRKRIEEELRRTRSTLSAGQSLANLGTWVWELQTNEGWLSDETYRVMGLDPESETPSFERFMSAFLPEDRDAVMQTIQSAIEERRPYDTEVSFRLPNGSVRIAHARGEPVHDDDGRPLRVIGAIQDITEQKRIEEELAVARDQALEASRLKSEFLATMSHEIRTPMNGVLGMLDLLLDTPLSSQQKDFTLAARGSAISLLTIINDVLDFSRIEAGKMLIDRTEFELTPIVEGAAEILAGPARERRNSLMTYVDPAIPGGLRGDPGRLRQVLVNLVGNAVKFTEGGEVTVRAMLDGADGSSVTVRFNVIDTGIGMTPDVQERLFQAFTQADATTTRRYGGTGLGLAIVRRLVELMGGTIGVESEVGKGSTFWFTVPFDASTAVTLKTPRVVERDLTDIRVLVADDNHTSREIIHRYILSWGMRNGNVPDASEALDALRRAAAEGDPYDVVILDMGMSEIGSTELAHQINAEPAIAPARLILLTALDQLGRGEQALGDGFSAYLPRPVRKSQLFDAIVDAVALPVRERGADEHEWSLQEPEAKGVSSGGADTSDVVLIAEDNPVNQKVARLQLERLGYGVEVVENGREAVEAMASSDRYALVFMDVQMPEMDGFAATRAIRKAEVASGRRTPIIAMTANALEGDREECLAAGMDDYLSKPVSRNKLREVLDRWLPVASEKDVPDRS